MAAAFPRHDREAPPSPPGGLGCGPGFSRAGKLTGLSRALTVGRHSPPVYGHHTLSGHRGCPGGLTQPGNKVQVPLQSTPLRLILPSCLHPGLPSPPLSAEPSSLISFHTPSFFPSQTEFLTSSICGEGQKLTGQRQYSEFTVYDGTWAFGSSKAKI